LIRFERKPNPRSLSNESYPNRSPSPSRERKTPPTNERFRLGYDAYEELLADLDPRS
jgi:hypothetical protein